MSLFARENRDKSDRHRRLWAACAIAHTAVDFGAATSFVAGSALFFSEELQTTATWLLLIGSIQFAAKLSIRMARELHYAAIGDDRNLAKTAGG